MDHYKEERCCNPMLWATIFEKTVPVELPHANKKEELNPEPQKSKKAIQRTRTILNGSITLGPMIIWCLIFFLFPLLYVITISFCQKDAYGRIQFAFTLANYQQLFSPVYLQVIWKSLKLAFFVTLIVTIIAFPYAYFVSRASKRVQAICSFLIMIPFWTNALLRIYGLINIMSTSGLINSFLLKLGIIQQPIQMLYTDFAVYVGMIYTAIPFMVLPLYANLQKLDPALLEAGRDLGCSSMQLFWKVIFPISLPGLASGIVLVFIPALGNFFVADAMGGGKSIIIGNVISNQFSSSNNWPFGSAVSVLLMVITTVLITANARFAERKSKVKGAR